MNQFNNKEEIREAIINQINSPNTKLRFGEVVDFSISGGNKSKFYRMCGGSLGGKARGLAFAKDMIKQSGLSHKFSNVKIKIPNTAIIGTDEFDRFMKDNKLWKDALWKGLWKVKAPSPYVSLEMFGQTLNALNNRAKLKQVK